MKSIYIAVAVVVLAGLGVYGYMHNKANAPVVENNYGTQTQQQAASDNSAAQPSPASLVTGSLNATTSVSTKPHGTFSAGEGDISAPDIQVVAIDYTGSQFTPKEVTIKAGDYVIFKNKSSGGFWPASNPHPAHTDYPGFDALKSIAPGGTYTFHFTKVGDWGFHDHLNHTIGGTVHVTK